MIMPSMFGVLCLILGITFVLYGIRNGFYKRNIQSGHSGSRVYGNQAIIMGIIYILGGIALLWTSYVVVNSLFLKGYFDLFSKTL